MKQKNLPTMKLMELDSLSMSQSVVQKVAKLAPKPGDMLVLWWNPLLRDVCSAAGLKAIQNHLMTTYKVHVMVLPSGLNLQQVEAAFAKSLMEKVVVHFHEERMIIRSWFLEALPYLRRMMKMSPEDTALADLAGQIEQSVMPGQPIEEKPEEVRPEEEVKP